MNFFSSQLDGIPMCIHTTFSLLIHDMNTFKLFPFHYCAELYSNYTIIKDMYAHISR